MKPQSLADHPAGLTAYLILIAFLPMISSDIFLPALPSIAGALGVPIAATQRLFDSYFVGLALSLLICGPLSDRIGRRNILLVALVLYVAGCVIVMSGDHLRILAAGRCLQGIGAGVMVALWRTVTFDALSIERATKAISVVVPVIVVSPALAPIVGESIDSAAGWRAIFAFLAAAGSIALAVTALLLRETYVPASVAPQSRWHALQPYRAIAGSRPFLSFCVVACAVYGAYFLYLFQAPLILLAAGYTPAQISYSYVPMTAGFAVGSFIGRRLSRRASDRGIVTTGVAQFGIGAALMIAWCLSPRPLAAPGLLFTAGLFVAANGILLTVGVARAMARLPHLRGTSSSLLGFSQALMTAALVGVMSRLNAQMPPRTSLAVMIFGCLALAAIGWGLFSRSLRTEVRVAMDK